jgi:purine-binding chemotaxis protein CheW
VVHPQPAEPRPSLLAFADQVAADAAAAAPAPPATQLHLITFRLDDEEFGLPVAAVREVIRVGDITRVPQAPEHIRGITNLRGRILPVVEIRTRLGLAPLEPGPSARIVVADVQERMFGLLVDAVAQVQKIPGGAVVAAPDEVRSADGDYVTGVAHVGDRRIILLDLERALAPSAAPAHPRAGP